MKSLTKTFTACANHSLPPCANKKVTSWDYRCKKFTNVVLLAILSLIAEETMGQTATWTRGTTRGTDVWYMDKTSENLDNVHTSLTGNSHSMVDEPYWSNGKGLGLANPQSGEVTRINSTVECNQYRTCVEELTLAITVPKYTSVTYSIDLATYGQASDGNYANFGCELYYWGRNQTGATAGKSYTTRYQEGDELTKDESVCKAYKTQSGEVTSNYVTKTFSYDNSTGSSNSTVNEVFAVLAYGRRYGGISVNKTYSFAVKYKNDSFTSTSFYSTVTYNPNGGSGIMPSQDIINSATLNANSFTRIGYTFTGWSTDPNATTATWSDMADFSAQNGTADEGRGPVTLYAIWTPKQYTLVITINEATATIGGASGSKNLIMTYGSTTNNTITDIVCDKWNLVKIQDASGKTIFDKNGNSIKGNEYFDADGRWINDPAGGVAYAIGVWEGRKTTVTLYASPGTFDGGDTYSDITLTQGSSDYFRDGNLTPLYPGYKFMGGYTEPNGGGTRIYKDHSIATTDGDYWKTTGTQTTEGYEILTWDRGDIPSMTLYAYWVPIFSPASSAANERNIKIEQTEATDEVTDADIVVAKTNMGSNANTLVYIDKGTYSGSASNILVKDDGSYTCNNFVVTDKQPVHVSIAFTATTASYTRTLPSASAENKVWGTICLPYAVSSDENTQYYSFAGFTGNTIKFSKVNDVPANTPAAFCTSASINATKHNVSIPVTKDVAEELGDYLFKGVQDEAIILPVGSDNYYIAQNKFWSPTKNAVNVAPQRAYFMGTETPGSSGVKVASLGIEEWGDTPTTICDAFSGSGDNAKYYDISGKQHDSLQPGLNILRFANGKTIKLMIER